MSAFLPTGLVVLGSTAVPTFSLHGFNLRLACTLIKQARRMTFEENERKLVFLGQEGNQKPLLEIQNTSSEEADRLAGELDLEPDSGQRFSWYKGTPLLWLYHDGSSDAEALLADIELAQVPCEVKIGCKQLTLRTRTRIYPRTDFTMSRLVQVVRRAAQGHKAQQVRAA